MNRREFIKLTIAMAVMPKLPERKPPPFKPLDFQQEIWEMLAHGKGRYVIYGGGRAAGKTYMMRQFYGQKKFFEGTGNRSRFSTGCTTTKV